MKRLTQLSVLLALLALCALPIHGVSADDGAVVGEEGGGSLLAVDADDVDADAQTWTIKCLDGRTTTCNGTYNFCRDFCDTYCGGGPGSCA